MTSVGLFWFFFRERLRNAFLFAQFRAKNSERQTRARGTSWKVLAHPSTYTRALGVAPDPRPGCSRGTGAMALEPPSHAGKRPGSLRASDGASSSGLQSAPSEVSAADSMRQVAARLEKHTAALRSAMDQTSRLDDGSASGASAKGALAAAAARALDADAADAASSSDDDDDDAEAAAREVAPRRSAGPALRAARTTRAGTATTTAAARADRPRAIEREAASATAGGAAAAAASRCRPSPRLRRASSCGRAAQLARRSWCCTASARSGSPTPTSSPCRTRSSSFWNPQILRDLESGN